MNVLYLSLKTFSGTGGIEQVNRNWIFALSQMHLKNKIVLKTISLYDSKIDNRYIDKSLTKCFAGNKIFFFCYAVWCGLNADIIILPHINLSSVGLVIKLIKPRIRIYIQAHGIEVWNKLNQAKLKLLTKADRIFPVSAFTKDKLISDFDLQKNKLKIISNYLSPIAKYDFNESHRNKFRNSLAIPEKSKLLITVCRLSFEEQYKGYDSVIECLSKFDKSIDFEYHLIGKYDAREFDRIKNLIAKCQLNEKVKILGWLPDDIIEKYYQAADLFVMPSKGEGFGLVYIEAMARGLEVIAGNKDGSIDALDYGKLGTLIDPDNMEQLGDSIKNGLAKLYSKTDRLKLSEMTKKMFDSKNLERQLEEILI